MIESDLNNNGNKGKVCIYKGEQEIRVNKDELSDYLSNGWQRGFSPSHRTNGSKSHIGIKPSNTGKHLSEEQKNKISQSLKEGYESGKIVHPFSGKHHTDETKEKLRSYSGEKNSQYGTHWTEERRNSVRDKIQKFHKTKDWLNNRTPEQIQNYLDKQYETKRKNNSFNTSKPEDDYYQKLLLQYPDKTIRRQYKDSRYPYYCDFYIVEDDLFIELNLHWTHGGMPFDETNSDCVKLLETWQQKSKQSQFFQNAIETWTKRDVEKANCAKENNLNYKVIYELEE